MSLSLEKNIGRWGGFRQKRGLRERYNRNPFEGFSVFGGVLSLLGGWCGKSVYDLIAQLCVGWGAIGAYGDACGGMCSNKRTAKNGVLLGNRKMAE